MVSVGKGQSGVRMREASSSAGRSTSPSRAADEQRAEPRLRGAAAGKGTTSSASSTSPYSFSAASSDVSPPLPVFKQSLSSALTCSGSSSLPANNNDNDAGAAEATPAKGKGIEMSREKEGRAAAAKEGRGRLSTGKEKARSFSTAGRRSVSPGSSTRVRRTFTAPKEEGLLGIRRGRDIAAGGGVETGKAPNRDINENEDEIRHDSPTAGGEGRGRWTTLFRGSRDLLEKGEGKGERLLLINSGAGYRARPSTRAGGGHTAKKALAVYGRAAAVRDLEGRGTDNRGEERRIAADTTLSSEVEQGHALLELKAKERKAKHWIIGSLMMYLLLGLLVLYCVSYANVEWCCIFIVFGGIVTGVGLCGLRQANRLTLIIHAVGAAVLLFTLFIAWCYNVYVLLRAVEILLASSWPPPHNQQFQYYYSIPSTYTSPPAPWIEEVLRMRLHVPFEDNAGIEMLIGRESEPADSSLPPRGSSSKRQMLPRHRRRRNQDLLPHTAAEEATAAEALVEHEAKEAMTEDLKPAAGPAAEAEERKGQTAGTTTAAQEVQQAGKQTPRKLGNVARGTSAAGLRKREERTLGGGNLRRSTSEEANETPRDAATRRLAAELQQMQGRRDAQPETPEKESEETNRSAGNKEMVFSVEERTKEQRRYREPVQSRTSPEGRVVEGLRAEGKKVREAEGTVNSKRPAAAEVNKKGSMQRSRTSLDWKRIWKEERSAGGLRRRLEETTRAAGGAATETSPAAWTAAATVSPAAGSGLGETREQSKKKEENTRRPHRHLLAFVSEIGKRASPSEASSGNSREVVPATNSSRPSTASSGASAMVENGVTAGLPLASASAAKPTDTGEDGPLAGQLRGSGEVLTQDRERKPEETPVEPSSSLKDPSVSDSDGDDTARAAASSSLTLAAAGAGGRGQLYEQQQRSSMNRDRAARRLIQGCVEGARNNPSFVGKTAHAMSSLATRGWLCAFARADVLPFHRWPVDCNRECGYEFLHAGHDLQTRNFYDMTRVSEYLIQIASLPPKRMQQCMDYAASTICSIQNRNFFVVWLVVLLLWLLFACVACCGILPFSLYSTIQVIKGMQQHA